jgi:hypothetical protein
MEHKTTKIPFGWYFIYEVEDASLVILKKPNKYDLSRLNDEIEQFVVENIIHPGVVDVLKLFDKHPTLASDILHALNVINSKEDSDAYDEISVTEIVDLPPIPEEVSQEDSVELNFDL